MIARLTWLGLALAVAWAACESVAWAAAGWSPTLDLPAWIIVSTLVNVVQSGQLLSHIVPTWLVAGTARVHGLPWTLRGIGDSPWIVCDAAMAGGFIFTLFIGGLIHDERGPDDAEKPPAPTIDADSIGDQVQIGNFLLPRAHETWHTLALGSTASGKSQIIRAAALVAQKRGDPAIVVDRNGEMARHLFRPEKDILLTAYDQRSVSWSPLAEIRGSWDIDRVAEALIPESGGAEGREWSGHARTYAAGCLAACVALHRQGQKVTNRTLVRLLNAGNPQQLAELVGPDHAVNALMSAGAERMLGSARGTAGSKAKAIGSLDLDAGFNDFSISGHVKNAIADGRWLYIPVPAETEGPAKTLASIVVGFFTRALMTTGQDEDRRYWLFFDELGQYDAISGFESALTEGRRYGMSVVCALQDIAQARYAYGNEKANVLLSNMNTRAIFRTPDAETAEWGSKARGDELIRRQTTSTSQGSSQGGATSSESESEHYTIERAVLPTKIQAQAALEAYIMSPNIRGARHCKIPYVILGEPHFTVFEGRAADDIRAQPAGAIEAQKTTPATPAPEAEALPEPTPQAAEIAPEPEPEPTKEPAEPEAADDDWLAVPEPEPASDHAARKQFEIPPDDDDI